jgi:hypothetical protein
LSFAIDHFRELADPRTGNAKTPSADEVLMTALCTVPCGGETCADMVLFGQAGVFAAILGPSTAVFRATRRLAVTVQGQYFLADNPLKPLFHRRPHARLAV